MTTGMVRADPSSMNHQGELFDSPHISVPMKGDITKIEPLVVPPRQQQQHENNHENRDNIMGDNATLIAARNSNVVDQMMIGTTTDNDKAVVQHRYDYQCGSFSMPFMHPEATITSPHEHDDGVVPHHDHGLLQSRQMDAIFRDSHAPASATSWSNIVSSNTNTSTLVPLMPSSPTRSINTTNRSISGETLLTSNIKSSQTSQQHDSIFNFAHLGSARARSQSFGAESAHQSQLSPSLLSKPHNLLKSYSFGSPGSSNNQHQQSNIGYLGIPPSHPGHSSYKDSTLPTMNQGGALQSSPMMYPSTPYHDFKRPSMGSYSPLSLGGDSMATDQTSPMSSPSLSPHVSPAMASRKHGGDGPPPMWSLSDSNDFRPEPPSPHHRLHPHLPQSIPEHHRHEPHHEHHHSPYMTSHHHGNSMRSGVAGPTSPPRLMHSSSSAHHHHQSSMHPRRGSRPHSGPSYTSSQTPMHHHRSSSEVLKTLLRKKACLYEPETSFAVSLVTWLVGRSLALCQGYFTRQQLQAGVHSCVAKKIEEGHVTRTKVNRCMQVILNSCFHYIIPRPDGSEECGQAFKEVFLRDAADDDGLLATLPAPWNDLSLGALSATEEGSYSNLFQDIDDDGTGHHPSSSSEVRPQGKEASSATSQAGDCSLDSGQKRSVLLCFNENIRCAADVFRCHNEFIRDVAHTGNLRLSPEDWQMFFSGAKAYRKRSASNADADEARGFTLADMHDRTDHQGVSKLRTSWCAKRYEHDHSFCAFAHVDINRGWLRRDPYVYSYKPSMCPYIKPLQDAEDCYVNMCPLGVKCNYAHSKEEILYHPENYKRHPCRNTHGPCPLGDICPHTHAEVSSHQGHGYRQGGKRHYHDHHSPYHRATYPGSSKRRASSSAAHGAGFGKVPPDGSPMLYLDPAPLSEFEKTLLLPGLQAIFRDHSSSIFYSTMIGSSSPYEYGPFGYRSTKRGGSSNAWAKPPIGKRVASY